MARYSPLLTLLLLPALPLAVRTEEKSRLKDVLTLQEAMEQLIEKAEPSVACVLVSRSDGYAKYRAAPSGDTPGKLGTFDARARLGPGQPPETRKEIIALDLSHPDHQPEAYGSGVVLDAANGLILTNAHVVRGATKIYVRLPGNRGSYADIHACDPRSDLAVLRLLDKVPDLKALKFGDGGKLRKGQFVVSIANPFAAGFRDGSPSASWGIVSNVRRRAAGPANEVDRSKVTLHHYGTLVQTDARLTLGCSGGALLNLDGELVGLTTAQAALVGSEAPGGFAVPFDDGLKRIVEVLRRGEEVEYGFLGVKMEMDARPGKGVKIAEDAMSPVPGSPAQRAGLAAGDLILSIEGRPVHENEDLFLYIGTQLAGGTITLEVERGGSKRTVKVKLAKYLVPGPCIASKRPPARAGLRVDYTSLIGQRPWVPGGFRGIPEGVLIREVVSNSAADRAKLQVDKVISKVDNRPVRTPDEFYRAMADAGAKVELWLLGPDGREERVTLDNK
jgi:S1-C subfamily serine protease